MSKFRQYIQEGGLRCPFCNCSNLETEYVDDVLYHPVHCHGCGKDWEDIYARVGVRYNDKEYFEEKTPNA